MAAARSSGNPADRGFLKEETKEALAKPEKLPLPPDKMPERGLTSRE